MIRTRFAPSPTGSLHVGGARTALYCLLYARRCGGRFVLRIEDTDRARSTEEAARGIVTDLRWLGLHWDEGPEVGGETGPYYQSQRLDLYDGYLQQLLASGHVYEAWETREELDALRQGAEAGGTRFRYRRRPYTDADLARFRSEGRTPVLRLANPGRPITVEDVILGDVTLPEDELEDIVVRKADGFPTYHFAVVIDDHLMGVSQVLRGQEHLKNTHKHVGIALALGWTLPAVGHLPLIVSAAGGKMSKREKARAARQAARDAAVGRPKGDWTWLADRIGHDVEDLHLFMAEQHDGVALAEKIATELAVDLPMIEVMDFRQAGFVPEALVNYLALLGWSPGDDREILTRDEMIEAFDLGRVVKTPARFDVDKLRWMNSEYLRSLDLDRILDVMQQWVEVHPSWIGALSRERRRTLLELYRARVHTFVDLERDAAYLHEPPAAYVESAVAKHLRKGGGFERLARARAALADAEWTEAGIEAAINGLAAELEVGLGKLAQPLRIAVTGGPVSPGIYETLAFIAKDSVLDRIDRCIDHEG